MSTNIEGHKIKRRRKRRFVFAGLLVVLVATGFYYRSYLQDYATVLIGQTFKNTVYSRSEGVYQIDYDSLQIDIFKGTAVMYNFSIALDSSKLDKVQRDVVFTAQVSKVTLKIKNLIGLPWQDRLKMQLVVLDDPQVHVSGREESRPTLSGKSGYLYHLLADEIRNFNVDELFLKNGTIHYSVGFEKPRGNFSARAVNLRIRNLVFAESEDSPALSTGEVFISMSDQQFALSDSIHKLMMDSMIISSADSLIRIKNMRIVPLQEADVTTTAYPGSYDLYRLHLPEVVLTGVDFSRAYKDNYLHIGQIAVHHPDFFMESPPLPEKIQAGGESQNHLAKMAAEMFNVVAIDTILLDSGSFEVRNEGDKAPVLHKGPLISARLRGFTLDTLNYKRLVNHINIDSGLVVVQNYRVQLPDSIHVLEMKRFSYKISDASDIRADSIRVYAPVSSAALSQQDHWNLTIPRADLSGLDVDAWLDNNRLTVDSVKLASPTFAFYKNATFSGRKSGQNTGSIKPLFLMRIGAAGVSDGKLRFYRKGNPYIKVDGLELSLKDVFNDNVQHTMQVDDQNFRLQAESAEMWPGNGFYLHLNRLSLANQATSRIRVKQASLFKEHTVDATFDDLELSVSTLYFADPNLAFTNVSSNHFNVTVDVAALKGVPGKNQPDRNSLKLLGMNFTNGTLSIRDGGKAVYSAEIDTLDVADLILTSSPTIDGVELYSHNNVLHQKRSPIYFKKLYLSQNRDSLSVSDLWIEEGIETSLPHIAVNGLVFDKIFDSKGIEASKMVLFQPEIVLSDSNENPIDTLNFADFAHTVDSVIGPVSVDSLLLTEAIIHHPDFIVENIRLLFLGVNINEGNVESKKIPFVENVLADVARFSYVREGFLVEAQNLKANLQGNFIKTDSLKLRIGRDSTLQLSMPAAAFSFFDMQDFLLRNRIDLERIVFLEPQLDLDIHRNTKKPRNFFEDTFGKGSLQQINVDSIEIRSATVAMAFSDEPFLKVADASALIKDLSLSAKTNLQRDIAIFSDLQFSGNNVQFLSGDTLSDMSAQRLNFSYGHAFLEGFGMEITPIMGKEEWTVNYGRHRDWLQARIGHFAFEGLEVNPFLNGKGIFSQHLQVDSALLTIFKDRRIQKKYLNKKPLLQERLLNLPVPVDIETASVEQSEVVYSEIGEKSGQPGQVVFADFKLDAANITNKPAALHKNSIATVDVSTNLMEAAPLEVQFVFDLASPTHKLWVNGALEKMPLTAFNRIVNAALLLDIKDGMADSLTFYFEGDSAEVEGKMRFVYHDLHIGFLRPGMEGAGLANKMAAFVANTFIIRSDNPGTFRTFRRGTIKADRVVRKSPFSYWTQAVLSGVLSSVGLKPAALKPVEKAEQEEE